MNVSSLQADAAAMPVAESPAPADTAATVSCDACSAAQLSAEALNRGCACRSLDAEQLRRQLEGEPSLAGLADAINRDRPHLFSATTVFITRAQFERIAAIVAAVEAVVSLPAYQASVLAHAPAIARPDHGPRGMFLGFDFHLDPGVASSPQLIEINTNAGGALLNAALARAQRACCAELEPALHSPTDLAGLEQTVLDDFVDEWERQRGDGVARHIAIVDETPLEQYLYPEFQLFQRLFERGGLPAVIADPRDLHWRADRLWHGVDQIDLVYNRLTNFYLEAPELAALRAAHEAGAVVLTPHPRAHALYANKRNLAVLSDGERLAQLGVPDDLRATLLAGVPATRLVNAASAESMWAQRRGLFFKPAEGFGSRAAYRGDKLTRRVWQDILAGDYVAQAFAAPSQRLVALEDGKTELKLDVRAYVHAGAIRLLAARLYAGQTTNFRTPGGGFAPVFIVEA